MKEKIEKKYTVGLKRSNIHWYIVYISQNICNFFPAPSVLWHYPYRSQNFRKSANTKELITTSSYWFLLHKFFFNIWQSIQLYFYLEAIFLNLVLCSKTFLDTKTLSHFKIQSAFLLSKLRSKIYTEIVGLNYSTIKNCWTSRIVYQEQDQYKNGIT